MWDVLFVFFLFLRVSIFFVLFRWLVRLYQTFELGLGYVRRAGQGINPTG